jgi:carbamoyl-phosphate synthase large subunit
MNVQYAVKDETVYILEVNPRASRTIPYVSKSIGVPLAKLASLVMAGKTLKELGFTEEATIRHCAMKEAVLPFVRFHGTDIVLSPEMKSTGEVMGIDIDPGMAYLKSQLAAGNPVPQSGNVVLSVCDRDKDAVVPLARDLQELGFTIFATCGTASVLWENKIRARALFSISKGRPNVLDLMLMDEVDWIINTPSGRSEQEDGVLMRADATVRGVPITTTMSAALAAVSGLKALQRLNHFDVCSIQEYQRHAKYQKAKA